MSFPEESRRRENSNQRPRYNNYSRSNRREWVPRGSAPVVALSVPSTNIDSSSQNDNGNGGDFVTGPVIPHRNRIHVGQREKEKEEKGKYNHAKVSKGVNIPQLVQEIQEKLLKGSVECMICYDMVRRSAPIWSCSSCYSIFHLNCIKKWARAPTSIDLLAEKNQGSNWRCPGCQSVQLMSAKEIRYVCFCGKRPDPPSDLYLTPHSCGEPCGKQLERELPGSGMTNEDICPHSCVLQCHPGPCPPCKAFAPPRRCPCGKKVINTRCSDRKSVLTCGQKCDKLLDCGRHHCEKVCYVGSCDSCRVLVNASCFCKKKIEVVLCGDMTVKGEVKGEDGVFSCVLTCENQLDCDNHVCHEICHPGPCGECELLPGKINTCCCGKTSLNEDRQSCKDPIPTCSQICGKILPCGSHCCRDVCHSGVCSSCRVLVTQKCRCGSTSRNVECFRTVTENEKFTCDKPCGHKKSCGRHRCSERCCPLSNSSSSSLVDWDPHLCPMPCEKKLRCGQHSCISLCHSGYCPTCPMTIFTDLACACGRTSIPPPLPCGTPPPSCQYPCCVPQPCGHPSSHSCHFGDCPPCTVPIAKECVGGHVVLLNIPCGSKDIRCNKLCGKTRQCGLHACSRICHPIPCDSSAALTTSLRSSCGQMCGAPRRDCRHTCTSLCHPSTPCPDVRCEFPVTITCSCGRITATVPCDAGGSNGGYNVDTVLEASIVQKLPVSLQPAEENGQKIPLGQRKLMCDDECSKTERKKVLADAFGVNPPNLDALHFVESASVSEVLSDLLRRDPKWVLSVEERCRYLVLGRGRGGLNALKVHVFCAMTKDKRDAVRLIAERWKLSINAVGWEPKRFIVIHVTPKSKAPARVIGLRNQLEITSQSPPISLDIPSPLQIPIPPQQRLSRAPSPPQASTSSSVPLPGNLPSPTHSPPRTTSPPQVPSHTPTISSPPNPNQTQPLISPPQSQLPVPSPPNSSQSTTSQPGRIQTRSKNNIFKPRKFFDYTAQLCHPITPTTYKQASQYHHWREAMKAEFDALLKNHTWDLVPRDSNKNVIACKWLFRVKKNPDGTIDRYKARLVAKGFTQRAGIDYHSTFSPVVKQTTVRLVLSIAVQQNWPLHQLDVNNAFLQGHLDEEVFMQQPPGFEHADLPHHVCRLRKAIYGLKQAPRAWYTELTKFLFQMGFTKSKSDHSLFILHHLDISIYILVYVDDIIVTGNNSKHIQQVISTLSNRFSLKDLGFLNYFLGVEVIRRDDGLILSQSKYVLDILHDSNMQDSKGVLTPMSSHHTLVANDGAPPTDATKYRKVIGKLQYLSFTQPDISYSVNKLSQFMHSPSENHWKAVKRVLRYLKQTAHYVLRISHHHDHNMYVYSDADWAGDPNDRTSTSGYLLYFGQSPISWTSKKQKTVARSSTEAEYRAVASAVAETNWVMNLLHELKVPLCRPPNIYCDNIGATYHCQNPVMHSKMKHIEVDFHFVRDQVVKEAIVVRHIHAADQLADTPTKALPKPAFLRHLSNLSVVLY